MVKVSPSSSSDPSSSGSEKAVADEVEPAPKSVGLFQLLAFGSSFDHLLLGVGIVCSVLGGMIQPFITLVEGHITNLYLTKTTKGNDDFIKEATRYALLDVGLGLGIAAATYLQTVMLHWHSNNVTSKIRSAYVSSVLDQRLEFCERHDAGYFSSLLSDNMERIRDAIGPRLGIAVRGVVIYLTAVSIAFYYNWKITLIMLATGPIGMVVMGTMTFVLAREERIKQRWMSHAAELLEEAIVNSNTVLALNGQQHMVEKLTRFLTAAFPAASRMHFWSYFFESCMFLVLYGSFTGGLNYSVTELYKGKLGDPGNVFTVLMAVMFGSYFLSMVAPQIAIVNKARLAAAPILNVIQKAIENRNEVATAERDVEPTTIESRIVFEHVFFSYKEGQKPVLNDLSFAAAPGETVALVGHSGSGKSSSIGLLTKQRLNYKGSIRVGNCEVRELTASSLRQLFGIVQQEPCLFDGTVAENIRLGSKEPIDDRKMMDAAKQANAHDFIMKLSNGYDTVIGSHGVQLSGGQKQRIAIARALVKNPKILLLDEATSALDVHSERVVQEALQRVSKERTTLVIAHRLSTLKDANRIVVLDAGRVVEQGTHAELMQIVGGHFRGLVEAERQQRAGGDDKKDPEEEDDDQKPDVAEEKTVAASYTGRQSQQYGKGGRASVASGKPGSVMGIALPQKEPEEATQLSIFSLWRLYFKWSPFTVRMFLGFIAILIRGTEFPLNGLNFRSTFEVFHATPTTYKHMLKDTSIHWIALGLFVWICLTAAGYLSGSAGELTCSRVMTRAMKNVLHQPSSYFDKKGQSRPAVIAAIAENVPLLKAAFDIRFVNALANATAIIIILVQVWFYSWRNGILGVVLILTFIVLQVVFSSRVRARQLAAFAEDQSGELAIEAFEKLRVIQLLNVEDHFVTHFGELQTKSFPMFHSWGRNEAVLMATSFSYLFFSDAAMYGFSNYLLYKGTGILTDVFTVTVLINLSGWAVYFASTSLPDLLKVAHAMTILRPFVEDDSAVATLDRGEKISISGRFLFDSVTFRYPARPEFAAATKLTIRAEPGDKLALVGPSGGGKSTIVSLLLRFYEPSSGSITLDGVNIKQIAPRHLRNAIGFVGQEPVLFRGSIRENLQLGLNKVSSEEITAACKLAAAHDFISSLPLGYETDVGEGGRLLSGGQKQRVAIARALLRNPKILLLDEATSALDVHSERAVQGALEEAAKARTSITIAHRLATIRNSSQIYYIEDGRVAEKGTHDDLMRSGGRYARLVQTQEQKK